MNGQGKAVKNTSQERQLLTVDHVVHARARAGVEGAVELKAPADDRRSIGLERCVLDV